MCYCDVPNVFGEWPGQPPLLPGGRRRMMIGFTGGLTAAALTFDFGKKNNG